MFYSHSRDKKWFPHVINTDEFRDNLTTDWGVRVHGKHHPTGLQYQASDESVKDRGVLAIHYAMKLLEKSGKPDLLRAFVVEINKLLDEIDDGRAKLDYEFGDGSAPSPEELRQKEK